MRSVVGVDIGGTNVNGGLLDGSGLGVTARLRHERLEPGADGLGPLKQRIRSVVGQVGAGCHVDVVGISVSGFISADRCLVTNSTLQLDQAPLAAELAADLGVPVLMENDANCAAWAEYVAGTGSGRNPFLLLTLGTGVGGGIIVNGQVVRGSHGLAGELGHLSINPSGPLCACGGAGCLELYASGRALVRAFAANVGPCARTSIPPAGPFDRTGLAELERSFARALAAGERTATEALSAVGAAVARGILLLARTIDPELIALGGGLSALGQPLLDAVGDGMRACPGLTYPLSAVPLVLARHRNNAGALGAALLAAAHPSSSC